VVDGTWHQLVGVRDTSTGMVSLYVDGVFHSLYDDQGLGNAPAGTPFLLGGIRSPDGTSLWSLYTGLMEDVEVYSGALSASEIAYLYDHPDAVVPLPPTVLLLGSGLLVLAG